MAAERYFGDSMTLSIQTEGGTSITIADIEEVEITVETNETEYFSADSTKRQDVKHTEKVPVVSATIGSFDVSLLQEWLGGSGTSTTGLKDTTDPQQYQITGSVTPSGGSTKLEAQVDGVSIANMPMFSASRNEFMGKEIEGRGNDITLTTIP